MRTFRVELPERVITDSPTHACACCMVSCGNTGVKRGVIITVTAANKQDAWDKVHREHPFERVNVLEG